MFCSGFIETPKKGLRLSQEREKERTNSLIPHINPGQGALLLLRLHSEQAEERISDCHVVYKPTAKKKNKINGIVNSPFLFLVSRTMKVHYTSV